MTFLSQTKKDELTLLCDGSGVIQWHVDASFAVHDDYKSHTGAKMGLGKGAIISTSTKQKVNTRSSTEVEDLPDMEQQRTPDLVGPSRCPPPWSLDAVTLQNVLQDTANVTRNVCTMLLSMGNFDVLAFVPQTWCSGIMIREGSSNATHRT